MNGTIAMQRLGGWQGWRAQTEVCATRTAFAVCSDAEKIIGCFDDAVFAIANGCVLP